SLSARRMLPRHSRQSVANSAQRPQDRHRRTIRARSSHPALPTGERHMTRYTIAGETFDDAAEVMRTYGAADYAVADWQEILRGGWLDCREGNLTAFPELAAEDIYALTGATMDYARETVAEADQEGPAFQWG